jgi:ParB family chromosome partitioning protein
MARISEIREVPVENLTVGAGQVRLRRVDERLEDLVDSIRLHGLLEPIVVCEDQDRPDRFEILMGQRRVLAHQRLGRPTILAAIIDQPVDLETAKALSLTENLIRRDLDSKDVIDACTALYRKYGSARAVAEETGIPYAQVLRHIKYDRLEPRLRQLVDCGDIRIDVALKAQDAVAKSEGQVDPGEAVDLAEALTTMTGAERRQILQAKRNHPHVPVKSLVGEFWNADEKDRQIVVTIPAKIHSALQEQARRMGITQDQAAARMLAAALAAV